MLGQPYSMLLPEVIGVKMSGKLKEGVTATDLVLTVTQMLRQRGVVGKFVNLRSGLANLTIADRATIGNMSPNMARLAASSPSTTTLCATSRIRAAGGADCVGECLCQGAGHISHAFDT